MWIGNNCGGSGWRMKDGVVGCRMDIQGVAIFEDILRTCVWFVGQVQCSFLSKLSANGCDGHDLVTFADRPGPCTIGHSSGTYQISLPLHARHENQRIEGDTSQLLSSALRHEQPDTRTPSITSTRAMPKTGCHLQNTAHDGHTHDARSRGAAS
jgi:hypothetical protein